VSFLDSLKMPDMSKIGDALKTFVARADAKLDAQTDAIKFLAEQVKKQNDTIADLVRRIPSQGAANSNSGPSGGDDTGIYLGNDPAGSGDLGGGGDANSDA
jgi:hypothetical protein